MAILNRIQSEYAIPLDLFLQLRQQLHHAFDKDVADLNKFIDELPKNLKGKTAWYIHEETWAKFKFVNEYGLDGQQEFLAWLACFLRPSLLPEESDVYREKEQVRDIFLLLQGECFF